MSSGSWAPVPITFTDEFTLLRGIIISIWVTALITVCLRFFARNLAKAGLWYDDWLTIPATVSISETILSSTSLLFEEDDPGS